MLHDHAHIGFTGGALQKAAAKQQSMLDDGASSSGEEDDDDEEEDDSDEDEDTAARKEMSIAYLKKTLTSQPLNGNAESDDNNDDDDDMEVGLSQAFAITCRMPCLQTHTEVGQVQIVRSCVTHCATSMTPFDTSILVSANTLFLLLTQSGKLSGHFGLKPWGCKRYDRGWPDARFMCRMMMRTTVTMKRLASWQGWKQIVMSPVRKEVILKMSPSKHSLPRYSTSISLGTGPVHLHHCL